MADEPQQEVFKMTPEQATARLEELSAAYRGPAPSDKPGTPAEASARLRQLTNDPNWRDGFLNGTVQMRREFQELTALAATGDHAPDLGMIETVDALSDSHALSREVQCADRRTPRGRAT
jgi:hypothetical protein